MKVYDEETMMCNLTTRETQLIITSFTFHSMCCGEAVGEECVIPSGKASPKREGPTRWSSIPQGALLTLLGLPGPLSLAQTPLSSLLTLTLSLTPSIGSTSPLKGRVMQLW